MDCRSPPTWVCSGSSEPRSRPARIGSLRGERGAVSSERPIFRPLAVSHLPWASQRVAMPARAVPEDRVFQEPLDRIADFKFNETVAAVFDDMVSRSVPQYAEIQRMLTELGAYFA